MADDASSVAEEQKGNDEIKGRNLTTNYSVVNLKRSNFILIWGCRPSMSVAINTDMAEKLSNVMKERFDRATFQLKIPAAFD